MAVDQRHPTVPHCLGIVGQYLRINVDGPMSLEQRRFSAQESSLDDGLACCAARSQGYRDDVCAMLGKNAFKPAAPLELKATSGRHWEVTSK